MEQPETTTNLPLSQVAVAVRKTTEALACQLVRPTDCRPAWTDVEWRIAQAAVAMQGIGPLLSGVLRWETPRPFLQFLALQRQHVASRHRRMLALLDLINVNARRTGVAVMALKGVALHALGIYQPGERVMADIDLLVAPSDRQPMIRVLESLGYEITATTWRHQTLLPRQCGECVCLGEHADNPIKIELHTQVQELLPLTAVDITPVLMAGPMLPGLNRYPSGASLMMHLLLHAAGNMRCRALRLIQLNDLARLAARFGPDDWQELRAACLAGPGLWWTAPPLMLTERYYPGVIPRTVLARVRDACPWWLVQMSGRQTLTAVSWSNVKVQAFPGIEWARTLPEAMRYARSRLWPSREALHDLEVFSKQNPRTKAIPWYGISHAERIVRWVCSRPPRVQSMLTIKAALEQA